MAGSRSKPWKNDWHPAPDGLAGGELGFCAHKKHGGPTIGRVVHKVGALSAEFSETEGPFDLQKLEPCVIDAGFDRVGFIPGLVRF